MGIQSFNRIKLDRCPRRANRRKPKQSSSASMEDQMDDLVQIEDNAKYLRLWATDILISPPKIDLATLYDFNVQWWCPKRRTTISQIPNEWYSDFSIWLNVNIKQMWSSLLYNSNRVVIRLL